MDVVLSSYHAPPSPLTSPPPPPSPPPMCVVGILVIGLQVAIVLIGLAQFEDSRLEDAVAENCNCEGAILGVLNAYGVQRAVSAFHTDNRTSQFCGSFNFSNHSMANIVCALCVECVCDCDIH